MSSKKTIANALIYARHNTSLIKQRDAGIDYKTYQNDIMRRYAIQYAFIVVCEAINDISSELLNRYAPAHLWRQVSDFRNFLAHTYDDIPDQRVINTIHKNLPELDSILDAILNDLNKQS